MSSSSLEKASLRLPWGREEVIVAVEAIVSCEAGCGCELV